MISNNFFFIGGGVRSGHSCMKEQQKELIYDVIAYKFYDQIIDNPVDKTIFCEDVAVINHFQISTLINHY